MLRATFANIRIVNQLTPDRQGGWTLHFPEGEMLTVDQAATRYQHEGVGTIVIAGAEYGTGSSRDWAAKGTALLGIRAVIAGSFERIHRSNLIGMGVLPLAFEKGTSWKELGLTGHEIYEFDGVESGVMNGGAIIVTARQGEKKISFPVFAQVFTQSQRQLLSEGGMAQQTVTYILRSLA
jgi:aconitate hydratase